jgi:hypothetical protein
MSVSIIGQGFIGLGFVGVYAFALWILKGMIEDGDHIFAMFFGSLLLIITGLAIIGITYI